MVEQKKNRSKEPSPQLRKSKSAETFLKFTGLGFSMMISIGVLGYLGYKLDMLTNTSPLFIVLGVLMGLSGNIYLIMKTSSDG